MTGVVVMTPGAFVDGEADATFAGTLDFDGGVGGGGVFTFGAALVAADVAFAGHGFMVVDAQGDARGLA